MRLLILMISTLSFSATKSIQQRDTAQNFIPSDGIYDQVGPVSFNRDNGEKSQRGRFLENTLKNKNENSVGKNRRTLTSEEGINSVLGVQDLPFIEYGHTVEFHFLLSSLPYNTDPALAKLFSQISAGTELPSFHAGLGVWDTTKDTKISIQFVPKNFLSCIIPKLSNGKLVWDNSGFIVVSDLLSSGTGTGTGSTVSSTNWRESRLVSTSSGTKRYLHFDVM